MLEQAALHTRIFEGFHELPETEFLPAFIRVPFNELDSVQNFTDLMPLFTDTRKHQISGIERDLRKFQNNYELNQKALRETQNVFSSEVDYI